MPCIHLLLMRAKRGQAMLESLFVLLLILAAFFLFFDFSYGIVSQLLIQNAAARAARADTVGFNHFHRVKAIRVATLPIAGKRIAPDAEHLKMTPMSELALSRALLQSENDHEARAILHYDRWDTLEHAIRRNGAATRSTVSMSIPRSLPAQLGALFGAQVDDNGDRKITETWRLEDHASYYLSEGLE